MNDRTDLTDLAGDFESHRTHLRAVAYRMLGTVQDADDVVQDAWLRLARTDVTDVENLGGWLTTVVSRLCLDRLRTRASRREDELGELTPAAAVAPDPAAEAELADAVGEAMLVVLETLSPAERLAFVLHDVFALPFDEIGTITGRSSAAVRQLASRGRRRVQSGDTTAVEADRVRQREVVTAFLAASKAGDLSGLVELLDPGAVVRSDAAAAAMGSPAVVSGGAAVAAFFDGRARAAVAKVIDGYAGAGWQLRGELKVAFAFTLSDDGERIVEIELIADPETLSLLDVVRA